MNLSIFFAFAKRNCIRFLIQKQERLQSEFCQKQKYPNFPKSVDFPRTAENPEVYAFDTIVIGHENENFDFTIPGKNNA